MTRNDLHSSDEPATSREEKLALEGPFISADDAAFWAHRRIDRRDVEYGGAIFQKEGRFFASTPLQGASDSFKPSDVIDITADGKMILPRGYAPYAFYHSHPDDNKKFERTSLTQDQRTIIRGFFSFYDIDFVIAYGPIVPAHYLSGPDDSLLKYVTSGAPKEQALRARIAPDRRTSLNIFNDVIPLLAEAGELWVLVANSAWGGVRGRVGKGWKPGTALSPNTLPPLFEKLSSSSDLGGRVLSSDGPPVFGYQLKAIAKEEYTVAIQAWERTELTPPATLFPNCPQGASRLPAYFRISAIYCRQGAIETWQHAHFFVPKLLAQARELLIAEPGLYDRLRLVLRTQDGALLAYRFSATDNEAQFLGPGGETVERQLKEASLSPDEFVLRMADLGELEVLQVGSVWRTLGRVQAYRDPFKQLQKAMSPAFITADDAARYLHERIREHGQVRLGYIVQRDDGLFVSTAPIIESDLSRELGLTFDGAITARLVMPEGYRHAGFFVSMANILATVKRGLPPRSDEDVQLKRQLPLEDEAKLYLSVPSYEYSASIMSAGHGIPALYYSSPFGSLVKYVRSETQLERNFSGLLKESVRTGTVKTQLDGFDGSMAEMVRKMVRLGAFHVLVSSPAWGGSRGKVPNVWAPYRPFNAAISIPPEYSWVFGDADTAAEYAHYQLSTSTGRQQIAFILKALQGENYVVTRPVVSKPGLAVFSPLHVFTADGSGQAVLPAGYTLYGICHSPHPPLGLNVASHWLYESFVSPVELAVAIADSRQPNSTLRALYLDTRDGARLKYSFSATALESQLYGITPKGVVTDNGQLAELIAGTLTPHEFVLRVAAAGALVVQQAGTMWDVEGVVDSQWKPFSRYPVLTLSHHFLSADDAARFAHEQIGSQRDSEYCGLILQTRDQRFVATLPWPCGEAHRFSFASSIFPVDHTGTPIVPHRYTLHGQYASCRAAALLDTTRMNQYGWGRNEAYVDWQLFSDEDLRSLIGNRHRFSVAYLSCAEDALLGYDLSGSAAELALLKQLEPSAQGSLWEQRRRRGELRPQNTVDLLAAVGLRIVVGSHLWGAAGAVAAGWRAFPAVQAHQAPEQVAFGAVFTSADTAARDAHGRVNRGYHATQTCFAFVLKHAQRPEYVVSQVVSSDQHNPLFSLASLFGTNDDGAYVYPSGFTLHSLFYARRWMPEQLVSDQQWLARHFMSSADLYTAFQAAKRWRVAGDDNSLPVYLSTLDNALLRYQAPISTALFNPEKQASGHFEDVHTLLASGRMTPQGFVTKVITAGQLTVVVANDCWDEAGKLTVDWLPYADFSRRALSPAFFSQADAVRYAQAQLPRQGDRVYGGLLLKRLDGLFVATEPVPVPTENFDPKWILPDEDVPQDRLAPGMTLVARYRSRRDTLPAFLLLPEELEVYRGMFSTEVLAKALACSHLWRHEYLLGFDGSLLGFSCADPNGDLLGAQQKQQLALDRQTLQQELAAASGAPHDPYSNLIEQQLREGSRTPVQFVNQVLKVAAIQVIQGSELWGNAQILRNGWLPAHGYIAPQKSLYATADRACGPLFSHSDDVARHAHEQAGNRDELTYGFILKARNGHWMASLPVTGEDLRFPLSRVLFRGALPPGCSIEGMYVCAPARQPEELNASPVYRSFVNPSLLRAALISVRQQSASGNTFLPLYLSCADGALLKYEAAYLDSDWDTQSRLDAYVKLLNGPFNPADYIRKVARAGTLQVLVTGDIWATQGLVLQTWTDRQTSAYTPGDDERLALGPLFSHADDAARYQWRRVRREQGKAWLGAIVGSTTGAADTFLVTEPVADNGPSVAVGLRLFTPACQRLFGRVMNQVTPQASSKYPKGYRVVGVQQLHKVDDTRAALADRYQQALADNFIAQQEFRAFVEMLRTDHVAGARYYLTPRQGALLVYVPSYQPSERDFLLSGWLDPDTDKPKATPGEVITTLATVGRLYILEPDSFWQPRGQVATRWVMEQRNAAS
ncbi:DUF4329 domain-containing protein [Pseudomonas tritici]|uniref:DUF4329 domain-containing protein n=1 Tax=Pseudomonas tritici TaxID=2745518 RepID=UPI00387A9969